MKKVKFLLLGILSILLISPVIADNVDLTNPYLNTYISHESLKSNYNITYGFYYNYNGDVNPASRFQIYYINSQLGQQNNIGYFDSTSVQSGNIVDTSISPFGLNGSNYSTQVLPNGYNGLLGIGGSNNILDPSRVSLYFQGNSTQVQNSGNKLLRFVGVNPSGPAYVGITNSYIRLLYDYSNSSDLWFSNSDFPTSTAINPATSIQLFQYGSNTFNTEKGRFSVDGQSFGHVVSSVGNGFSFVPVYDRRNTYYWDQIKFYSVFNDRDINSSFNIPSSKYTNQFFMFKIDSFKRNSQFDEIGVLSKCTPSLCSGITDLTTYLSSLVFSNYICDFSSSYNFKDNCILGGGGILVGVLGNITGLNTPISLSGNAFILNLLSSNSYSVVNNTIFSDGPYSPSVGYSIGLLTNPYRLNLAGHNFDSVSRYKKLIYSFFSYDISYTGGYTISNNPDILGLAEYTNPDMGGELGNIDLNSGSAQEILDNLCNSYVIKPVWCQGISEVATGVDGFWWVDLSGNLVYSLVGYDSEHGAFWYDLVSDGSGGYQFVCDLSTNYYCPITGSFGSIEVVNPADPHAVGFSGFILSEDYYNNFFTKTGYFAKCPYPYTDINIGLHSNVLNKFYNTLGFDIFLPINCGIAAFTAGKSFRFLSDVNLGFSPLMGEIHGPSDPRVYLYRFLDFLFSFALFMFLLKLYHLLN